MTTTFSQITQPGDGKTFPKPGSKLSMHYTGTLQSNGKEFDSSHKRGKPFEFTIGVGQVFCFVFIQDFRESNRNCVGDSGVGRGGNEDESWREGSADHHVRLRYFHLNSVFLSNLKTVGPGYGPSGAGGVIPPNANLVFDVELLAIMS